MITDLMNNVVGGFAAWKQNYIVLAFHSFKGGTWSPEKCCSEAAATTERHFSKNKTLKAGVFNHGPPSARGN